jgi:hypothetical protein
MRWARAWVVATALAAGCGLLDDEPITVEDMCTSLCDCAQFPSAEARCQPECVEAFTGFPLPQPCMECLAALECDELAFLERECADECALFAIPVERTP